MESTRMILMAAALGVALGPALALAGPDTDVGFRGCGPRVGDGNDSETDVGVNLLGGIEREISKGDRFFVEAKFSLNDAPDAKITVGWTFYH